MSPRSTRLAFALAAPLFAPVLSAQGVGTRPVPTDFVLPVHRSLDDNGISGGGLWSAGATWKARFDAGFEFFPVLGAGRPRNLPWRWQTIGVSAGTQEVVAAGTSPRIAHGERTVVLDHGPVLEQYEVRPEGVEQFFVLAQRPTTPGEITVRGRIETELVAEPFRGHGALLFRATDGSEVVRYGAALAIDASGATSPVTTTWSTGEIALTVPAEFVERARFPLTIDPLTASVSISSGTGVVQHVAIAAFPGGTGRNTAIAFTRSSSATDEDLFFYVCNEDFTAPLMIHSDVTASWSTSRPSVTAVEGANRWVLAFQRDFVSPDQSAIRTYMHDFGNTTFGSGSELTTTINVGNTHRNVQVGGSTGATGKKALLVWQTDVTTTQQNTSSTAVQGRILDVATKAFAGPAFALHATVGGTRDREHAAVSRMAAGTGSWVTAWQEYDTSISGDDWDLRSSRISQTGTVTGDATIDAGKSSFHSAVPRVAGQAGRYAVSWIDPTTVNGTGGTHLFARRFDWADAAVTPTLQAVRTVDTLSPGTGEFENAGIAYDDTTLSHWAVAYRHIHRSVAGSVRIARLGATAGVVEKATAFTNTGAQLASDVTHHRGSGETWFAMCFRADVVGNGVYGTNLLYGAASSNLYGTGCGGSITLEAPLAGSEFYATRIAGLPAGAPATLFLSGGTANVGLGTLGMTGCVLNVSTTSFVTLNTVANATGQAVIPLPLPDAPVAIVGDLYTQWFWAAPGANALGVLASQGTKHAIR